MRILINKYFGHCPMYQGLHLPCDKQLKKHAKISQLFSSCI